MRRPAGPRRSPAQSDRILCADSRRELYSANGADRRNCLVRRDFELLRDPDIAHDFRIRTYKGHTPQNRWDAESRSRYDSHDLKVVH